MQNHRHQLTCRALLQFNKQKKNNRYWNSCYALNQNRTMLALKTEKKSQKNQQNIKFTRNERPADVIENNRRGVRERGRHCC